MLVHRFTQQIESPTQQPRNIMCVPNTLIFHPDRSSTLQDACSRLDLGPARTNDVPDDNAQSAESRRGVLLAFDAANEKSFDELLPWRKCIEQGSEQR